VFFSVHFGPLFVQFLQDNFLNNFAANFCENLQSVRVLHVTEIFRQLATSTSARVAAYPVRVVFALRVILVILC
jgi:hypothetical protein